MNDPVLRPAGSRDVEAVARLWHEAWTIGHAELAPPPFARHRTLDVFRQRVPPRLASMLVAEAEGVLGGMVAWQGDEIDQPHVARDWMGTGLAQRLLAAREETLRGNGVARAHLYCLRGNERARRFYEQAGWSNEGDVDCPAETPDGPFPLPSHLFVKELAA